MNKIITFITGALVIGFIFLNVVISSNNDSTKKFFNLYSIATAFADESEGTGNKSAKRNTETGTLTETCTIGETEYSRTCTYHRIWCTGEGDIECNPSFTVYGCSSWVEI